MYLSSLAPMVRTRKPDQTMFLVGRPGLEPGTDGLHQLQLSPLTYDGETLAALD